MPERINVKNHMLNIFLELSQRCFTSALFGIPNVIRKSLQTRHYRKLGIGEIRSVPTFHKCKTLQGQM